MVPFVIFPPNFSQLSKSVCRNQQNEMTGYVSPRRCRPSHARTFRDDEFWFVCLQKAWLLLRNNRANLYWVRSLCRSPSHFGTSKPAIIRNCFPSRESFSSLCSRVLRKQSFTVNLESRKDQKQFLESRALCVCVVCWVCIVIVVAEIF